MNLNSLFNMVMKMFARGAVDAGIKHMARKGKPEAKMTPEDRAQAKAARDMAQRAGKASRIARRLWR